MVEEVEQRRVVGVLEILHEEHHRAGIGQPFEEQPPTGEQFVAGQRGRACRRARRRAVADTEQPSQARADIGPLGRVRNEPGKQVGQLGRRGIERVFLGDPEALPDHLAQSPVRDTFAVGQAAAAVPPHHLGESVDVLLELPAQPRFPDPGRAGDHDQPRAFPVGGRVEQLLDRAELRIATDERRLETIDALRAADPGEYPRRAEQCHRLALALEVMFAFVGEADGGGGEPPGRVVDPYLSRPGGRLDTRGGVDGVPRHHALPDGAESHRHLAGDDSRPQRESRCAELGAQRCHRRHQVQPGAHGSFGVALGGRRGTPHGHHRVADELLHHPAVALDDRASGVEVSGEQFSDRLRILRLRQRGEADEVGEEHRTHAPLRNGRRRDVRQGTS
ncbi:MAG TPA: hypothetical protein VFH38_09160 [Jatrophihabitans sp.]|nr:hypothetical protein [Jatrophihabitans sp.]